MSRVQRVAPVAAWVAVMAPLSVVFLSLVTSPDSNGTLRASLIGLGILAILKPDAALLITAAMIGFGSILSHLFGIASARITEVLVDGESGLLVDKEDVRGMAAALVRLHDDRDFVARLGANARRRFEEHLTLDRFGADVLAELRAALASDVSRMPAAAVSPRA